jgi:hypothetical protein
MPIPYSVKRLNRLAGTGDYFFEPSVAQPPLPLQEFLPAQPLSPAPQPPLPLQEFWPLQPCLSLEALDPSEEPAEEEAEGEESCAEARTASAPV